MSDQEGQRGATEGSWAKTIIPAILITIVTTGSAPWWWNSLFGSHAIADSPATTVSGIASVTPTFPVVLPHPTVPEDSSPQTTVSTMATPARSIAGGETAVRNSTKGRSPLIINDGFKIDLDSRAINWGVTKDPLNSDLRFDGFISSIGFAKDWAPVQDATVGKAACDAATDWSNRDINLENVDVPYAVCAHTDQGRESLVIVDSIAAGGQTVQLEITTWN